MHTPWQPDYKNDVRAPVRLDQYMTARPAAEEYGSFLTEFAEHGEAQHAVPLWKSATRPVK